MKKKLLIGIGIIVLLFVVTAAVVPLVVDVEQFRPKLVETVNQNIHGKFTLGKLKLSLWGKIKIKAEGLSLVDSQGKTLVAVNDVYFYLPFLPLITGSPTVVINMNSPEVNLVKNSKGQWNILQVVKSTESEKSASSDGDSKENTNKSSKPEAVPGAVPAILARARLGVELQSVQLSYHDQMTGLKTEVRDLNVRAKDLSLSKNLSLEIWANLKTTLKDASGMESFRLEGPARVEIKGKPEFSNGLFKKMDLDLNVDLTDLGVYKEGVFEKKPGVVAKVDGQMSLSLQEILLQGFKIKFHHLVVVLDGKAQVLSDSKQWGLDLGISIPKTDLKPFADLFPSVPKSGIGGTVAVDLKVKGPADQLGYLGFIKLQELIIRHEMLKNPLTIDADLSFKSDQMDKIYVKLQAPKNELTMNGTLVSFSAPKIDLAVTSSGLNMDELVNFPEQEKGKAQKEITGASAPAASGAAGSKSNQLDQEMGFIRNNAFLAKSLLQLNVDIKSIVAKGAVIEQLRSQIYFKNLVAGFSSLSLKAFGGSLQSKANLDFKPLLPRYDFSATVANINLQKAVESQLPSLKNTVLGLASFQATGAGQSLNSDRAMKNLNLRGNFSVKDAQFASIDVAKMATDAIEKSLSKVSEKIPGLKEKVGKKLSGRESKYEKMSGTFTMSKGVFLAPDFVAQSLKDQGVDLKGETQVDLVEQKINAKWWVIDVWNMTGAVDVSVQVSGSTVPRVLAEKDKPVQFPVTVGCELSKPCYSYNEVPEHFIKVAFKNSTGVVKDRVKQEVKDQTKKVLQDQGKDILKGLKGKFF